MACEARLYMPSIGLYHFTKKSNSTALPDPKVATWVTFTYKNDCSTHSPILLFEWGSKPDFTYAQIESNYYFITDIVYVRQKLWQLELKEDCLGTFREQIKASNQLIDRTSTDVDSKIVDSFYPRLSNPVVEMNTATLSWSDPGSYILSVADGKGLKYYALTYGDFITLTQRLFAQSQDSLWDTIADATKSITRTFLNVMQYIVSCHWVPLPFANEAKGEEITLGYWPTGVIATPLSAQSVMHPIGDSVRIGIANNARVKADWLNSPGYNHVILHLPMCGNIELDASIALAVDISLDVDIYGKMFYGVSHGGRALKMVGDCGVPVALSSAALPSTAPAGVAGFIGGVGSIVAGANGGGLGMILGGIAGAGVAETQLVPEPQTTGSQSGFLAHKSDSIISVTSIGYNVPDDMSNVIGYPLMKQKTLSANGYYLILKPVVNFGDYYENQEIVSMMEGGFYVE